MSERSDLTFALGLALGILVASIEQPSTITGWIIGAAVWSIWFGLMVRHDTD